MEMTNHIGIDWSIGESYLFGQLTIGGAPENKALPGDRCWRAKDEGKLC